MTSLTKRCYLLRLTSTTSTNRPNPSRIPSSAKARASQHQACRSRHSSNPRTSNLNPEIDRSIQPSLLPTQAHSTLHLDPITSRPRLNHRTLRSPRNSRMPSKKPRNPTKKAIQTTGEESAGRDLCRCPVYVFRRQRSDRSIVWLRADQPLASPEAFVLRQGRASLGDDESSRAGSLTRGFGMG
jgi:hypothetical protein